MNWKAFAPPLKRCEASCRETIRNCGGREKEKGLCEITNRGVKRRIRGFDEPMILLSTILKYAGRSM